MKLTRRPTVQDGQSGEDRGHDAVHAATAIVAGFDQIVSVDRDFDGMPGSPA